jgi:hypothetical protein
MEKVLVPKLTSYKDGQVHSNRSIHAKTRRKEIALATISIHPHLPDGLRHGQGNDPVGTRTTPAGQHTHRERRESGVDPDSRSA